MRLCIVVSNSLRKDPRVIKQIRCAMEKGIEVYFIGFRDKNYNKKFLQSVGCHISLVDLGNNYVGYLKSIYKKLYRRFMQFYLPIKMMVKIKPDVIHANDFDTLIQSFIASKLCNCKILYDAHEINAENIGITDRKIEKYFTILIERFIVKRVGAMVSVSHSAAEYFKEKYRIPLPVVVTNCPYKINISLAKKKDLKNFEALYQGMMIKGRGYEEFVESGKFINDKITLVLRGYGSIADELKKIISEQGLENKIRFDAPVEIKDIIPMASNSHLGVVLTKPVNINFKYTVSNKIFEYMHAGLPVLMSDIPEHQYLNNEFNFGIIVKDFSAVGIATCINQLAADREKYNLLRKNAIKASHELCWENESLKLIDLYHKLYRAH